MTIQDPRQLSAGCIYLAVYVVMACITFYGIGTRRPNRRYIGIALFSCVRLASQVASVGFAVVGYQNTQWLLAYFILGAEGYFALILSTMYIVVAYQEDFFEGGSWIHPKKPTGLSPVANRTWKYKQFSFWFHFFLIVPNALIIAGGSLQSNALATNPTAHDFQTAETGRKMRIVGQSIFLGMTIVVLSVLVEAFMKARKDKTPMLRRLGFMLVVSPCLIVRGVFGVLQAGSGKYSYYNYSNYGEFGLSEHLLVAEYVAATTMEFLAAVMILYCIWISTKTKAEFFAQKHSESRLESHGDLEMKESREE